jgi:tryptophan 2,3-dioxygenase
MTITDSRAESSIHWDVGKDASYGGYLALDQLLSAQRPRSTVHDEMLFIIIHQTSELWIKLLLHELGAMTEGIRIDALAAPLKIFARIGRIQMQLIQSWDVLSTLTPRDYVQLRPHLGPSSGFQSYQYRQLEFILGNKDARLIEVHRRVPAHFDVLKATLEACGCWRGAVWRCLPRYWSGIGQRRTRRIPGSRRCGCRYITTSKNTGIFTISRRSWWISRTDFSNGGFVMSRP